MTAAARLALGGRTHGLECSSTTTTGVSSRRARRAARPDPLGGRGLRSSSPLPSGRSCHRARRRRGRRAEPSPRPRRAARGRPRCLRHRRARLPVGMKGPVRVRHEDLDLGAAGVGDRPARGDHRSEAVEHGLDRLSRVAVGHPVDLPGGPGPVAELCLRVIGVRAEHCDGGVESDCPAAGSAASGLWPRTSPKAGCRRWSAARGSDAPARG